MSLLDRQTAKAISYEKQQARIQLSQPAPPLAKVSPLKKIQPGVLQSKIASYSIGDQELLLQNDKIGKINRRRNQVPKVLSKVENEIIKEFELSNPTGFEARNPRTGAIEYRQFNTEGIEPPDLQPPAFIEGLEDYAGYIIPDEEILQRIKEIQQEKLDEFAEYEDALDFANELEVDKQMLIDKLNRGNISQVEKVLLRRQIEEIERNQQDVRVFANDLSTNIEVNYTAQIQYAYDKAREHNALVKARNDENLQAIKLYQARLNLLNSNAFNTEKQPNETEDEYLQRLVQNAEMTLPENQLQEATNQIRQEFRKRISELTKDTVKIDQISNSFETDDKHNLIKIWRLVKDKYNRTYGLTNKSVEAETIVIFLQGLLHREESISELPSGVQDILSGINEEGQEVIEQGNLIISPNVAENYVMVQKANITGQPPLYFKVVHEIPGRHVQQKYALLYSFNGQPGSYKEYFAGGKEGGVPADRTIMGVNKLKSNDEIREKTGITTEDICKVAQLTPTAQLNPYQVSKKLIQIYRIPAYTVEEVGQKPYGVYSNRPKDKIEYGLGIPKVNEPKFVPFGHLQISLPNLKYKNTLSVRTHLGKTIGGIPNVKISKKLTSILLNLFENLHPTHEDINRLSAEERHLYDRVVHLGKLHTRLPHTNEKTVADLKKRLKLLEGEIEIGNNSPQLITEIKHILKMLKDLHVITEKQKKEYEKLNFK
jgi:hypothetical protein